MSEFESRDSRIAEIRVENFMISPSQPHMEIMDTRRDTCSNRWTRCRACGVAVEFEFCFAT